MINNKIKVSQKFKLIMKKNYTKLKVLQIIIIIRLIYYKKNTRINQIKILLYKKSIFKFKFILILFKKS